MTANDLVDAARRGDADTVQNILRTQPELAGSPIASGETAVMAALYRGHHHIVNEVAAVLERNGRMDIFAAAALGRMDALERVIAAGVNVFAYDGWTPLHLAAFFGRTEVVERLLKADADLHAISRNALKNTPLHAAIAGGHVDVALTLIAHGAAVDVADAGGHTPLHIAAEAGLLPVARALVARGADPLAVDSEDLTPLARAAARNQNAIVDLFNERA
jgi:ankyrin repeat protein